VGASHNPIVVMVVGGPQYRVGSHRMYVTIARALAGAGVAVLRFDCRGMGDSDGTFTSFENLDDDIRSAVDAAVALGYSQRIVLFGLCDAASAVSMYGYRDPRVSGLVLLNPWVRTPGGEAKAKLRHYYGMRVWQAESWRRLFQGRINVLQAAKSFLTNVRRASTTEASVGFVDRMLGGLSAFGGPVEILLSTADLTAQEFGGLTNSSDRWRKLISQENLAITNVVDADHTLSDASAMDYAVSRLLDFVAAVRR
jgi:uncharacterized protein